MTLKSFLSEFDIKAEDALDFEHIEFLADDIAALTNAENIKEYKIMINNEIQSFRRELISVGFSRKDVDSMVQERFYT